MSEVQEQDPQERLAAIKARRKALAEAEAAKASSEATDEAIRKEERALRDDEGRAKARADHGKDRIATITGVNAPAFDCVVVKRPDPAAFKAFQDKEGFKGEDLEALVSPCVVYPTRAEFDKLITFEQPGVLTRVAEAVCFLAGARKSSELGKA
jgi:hypothetical protein